MIFRIKRCWRSSLTATVLMLVVAYLLGGTEATAGRLENADQAAVLGVVAGLGCMLVNLVVHLMLRGLLGARYDAEFQRHALEVVGRMGPAEAVAGGIMAALGEEPLFRGVLVTALGSSVWGVVVAAVLFGLAHWLRREYLGFFIWAIGEGLVFGSLFVLTGSIVVPAVAHGMFDTVGFLYFQRLRRLASAEEKAR